jgi:hypothetical protein
MFHSVRRKLKRVFCRRPHFADDRLRLSTELGLLVALDIHCFFAGVIAFLGRTDITVALHALDDTRRAVITDAQPPLEFDLPNDLAFGSSGKVGEFPLAGRIIRIPG